MPQLMTGRTTDRTVMRFRLSSGLRAEVIEAAAERGENVSEFVRRALHDRLSALGRDES